MTIKYLRILWTVLAVTGVKMHSLNQSPSPPATIIENKNVNVIVNVDAEELAQELWKVIESRLNKTDNVTYSQNIINDLEMAVGPLVSPSRRGNLAPSAFQVANELDKITRKALTGDASNVNTLDEEIKIRDIVANMMASLKKILPKTTVKPIRI